MYCLRTEGHFDSAHFLHGYEGKCSNIHGHRWKIVAEICADELEKAGNERGMLVDFGTFKTDLKKEADALDHALLAEENTLREITVKVLQEEGFRIIFMPFRPTAENLSRYFWDRLKSKGYPLKKIEVYETPTNCAVYSEE